MKEHTQSKPQVIVGTSGYSFTDWVGPFYPEGTARGDMLAHYVQHFPAVELNSTYYRMPNARTLAALARNSPERFLFWVKANQETTHKQNRQVAGEFLEALTPLTEAGKLAGVLLQFPQSFHRTVENRMHSRNAEKWYAGAAERYDYSYSAAELQRFATDWTDPTLGIDRLFAFFNNCHQSQAAANAQAFQRILAGMP